MKAICFWATLLLLLSPLKLPAQTIDATVDQHLINLENNDWRIRQDAVSKLNALQEKPSRVKKALLSEFERELAVIQSGTYEKCSECDDGGEQGYYSYLFEIVSDLQDDSAFPTFLKIGSATALIKFGDKGINAILENFNNRTNCSQTYNDIDILGQAINPESKHFTNNQISRNKIRTALINALNKFKHPKKNIVEFETIARSCATTRTLTIRALKPLAEEGDTEIIEITKLLAKNDPQVSDFSNKTNYDGPKERYFVREEANKILNEFSNK